LRRLYLTPEASEHPVLPSPSGTAGERFAAGTDDTTGSNNWALGPARTGTGAAILAGDPHQPFWVPSSWYEFVLEGPEDRAGGAGHPGLPGLWWGSNGAIAWGITNNAASTRDLYRESVKPDDATLYRDDGTWRKFSERRVMIPVRGETAQELTIRSTVRGPIVNALIPAISEGGDPPLSLRWIGAEHLDDLQAMIVLSRARNWPAFRDALRNWAIAVFNFVYADGEGHIGYQMAGRIPLRGRVAYGFRNADNPEDSLPPPISGSSTKATRIRSTAPIRRAIAGRGSRKCSRLPRASTARRPSGCRTISSACGQGAFVRTSSVCSGQASSRRRASLWRY
jgi:penicillin G amidase